MSLLWNKFYMFAVCVVLLCNGKLTEARNEAVERIIQKVYNLTSQSLKDASPNEREKIMKDIEAKLIKSAVPLGSKADKYVKLIMQGLLIMANNLTKHQNDRTDTQVHKYRKDSGAQATAFSKDAAAKDLAKKILRLAEKYVNQTDKTHNQKQKIMEDIKNKILETAKQKHDLIHVKHHEIKKYTDLITRGMELMMKKITQSQDSKQRRMIIEIVNSNRDGSESREIRQHNDLFYKTNIENNRIEDDSPTEPPMRELNSISTTPISCDDFFHRTCSDIKSLNEFVCRKDGSSIPLSNLCDGVMDCEDGTDEGDCIKEAMDRLQIATSLMVQIETYLQRKCFIEEDNGVLIKQNNVLVGVLNSQMSFINKYKTMDPSSLQLTDAFAFKRTLNEVVGVINTLAIALHSSLCVRLESKKRAQVDARKYNPFDADDLDELTVKPVRKVSLKSCACSESFCTNLTCAEACKRVCWHKYNLGRWSCQAVDQSTSVPLDMVCDGKLDCYDETDENNCVSVSSYGKFEANEVFENILKMITKKSTKKEYSNVKNKLAALGNSILQLQKNVMKPKVDVHDVKNVRDICYASLASIYEDLVSASYDIHELDDAHTFLMTVNERLMYVLKRTHTGNDRIISADGCFCRQGKCAATKCTPSCKRACVVNPKFTRYWCKGTVYNNISVPLEGICNGMPNCPREDDENRCSNDVCRKHHFMLIRRNVRDVGERYKGTSLGETLRTWKSKVVSTLKVAENSYRPTPATLRDLIGDMLQDLVTMYASMDDTRRTNNDYVVKEFYEVSQMMIENLKSCGK